MRWSSELGMGSTLEKRLLHCTIILILLSDTVYSLAMSGELRCYCNLPNCIPNGYMCKTSGSGRCFFFLEYSRVTVQGCTDLFPTGRVVSKPARSPAHCDYHHSEQSFPQLVQTIRQRLQEQSGHRPTVGCCKSHMCNHVEYTDPLETRLKLALSNASDQAVKSDSRASLGSGWYWQTGQYRQRDRYHPSVTDQEMWFKAAVIAVPIAGGFIMLVLVFIAFRLLRQDAHLRRKYNSYDSPNLLSTQRQQLFYPDEINPTIQPVLGSVAMEGSAWPKMEQIKKGTVV